jgi:hypothetical protein
MMCSLDSSWLTYLISCITGPWAVLLFQATALSINIFAVLNKGWMGPLKRVKHDRFELNYNMLHWIGWVVSFPSICVCAWLSVKNLPVLQKINLHFLQLCWRLLCELFLDFQFWSFWSLLWLIYFCKKIVIPRLNHVLINIINLN